MPDHIKSTADRIREGKPVWGFEVELLAAWIAGWRKPEAT